MAANQRIVMTVFPIDDATQNNCFKFFNNYQTKPHPIFCKIVRIVLKKVVDPTKEYLIVGPDPISRVTVSLTSF